MGLQLKPQQEDDEGERQGLSRGYGPRRKLLFYIVTALNLAFWSVFYIGILTENEAVFWVVGIFVLLNAILFFVPMVVMALLLAAVLFRAKQSAIAWQLALFLGLGLLLLFWQTTVFVLGGAR